MINESIRVPALIFIIAIVVRWLYIGIVPPRPMEWDDSKGWNFVAMKFMKGEGFLRNTEGMDPKRPPLYPLFLATIYHLFGEGNFLAVKLTQGLLGAFSCLLFYRLAVLLFGTSSAFWAGLAMAIYPPLIVYSEILVSESIFILLFYSFLLLWLRLGKYSSIWISIAGGILLGLLNLCRGTLILFPFVLILFFPLLKKTTAVSFRNFLIMILVSFLIIAPWSWRNYKVYRGFIPTASGGAEQFWSGTLPWTEQRLFGDSELMKQIQKTGRDVVDTERLFLRDAFDRIAASPWSYLKITIKKFFFFWFQPIGQKLTEKKHPWLGILAYGFHAILVLLFLIGVYKTIEHWKKLTPVYLLIGYMSMLHILLAPEPRYRLPLEPLFLLFASRGISVFFIQRKYIRNNRGKVD